jgi:hypothetical protein|tara:strand:- start:21428 stop:21721 length:294 start_codon:yes stop_codon:yes gene_type:complete
MLRLLDTKLNDVQEGILTEFSYKKIDAPTAKAMFAALHDNAYPEELAPKQRLCAIIAAELYPNEEWGMAFILDHPEEDVSRINRLANIIFAALKQGV